MMHSQDALDQMRDRELEQLRRSMFESVGDLAFLQGTAPVEFLGRRKTEYAAHLIKELTAENQRLRDALERLLDDEFRCDADWIIARAALEVGK